MKRLTAFALLLAPLLVSGCIVTPAYRVHGRTGAYYYGQDTTGSAVIYSNGSAWYPYGVYGDGYGYGPWVPYAGARVYVRDGDGYRHWDRDGYRTGPEHWHDHRDGHAQGDRYGDHGDEHHDYGRHGFAARFRDQAVRHAYAPAPSHRLAPAVRQAYGRRQQQPARRPAAAQRAPAPRKSDRSRRRWH